VSQGRAAEGTTRDAAASAAEWWRGAAIYEVYVRSFRDADGDGQGDLKGLIEGLDYLAALGIDAIWITPVSPSPNFDSGYDVLDYCAIAPAFGTMGDFKALVAGAHARGLKVVLDQVYSHSSHLHPWFVESASSRINPKADWYVWADPKPDGGPPNNWLGRFGGFAWEWNGTRRQYYLHNFLIEQPDLNLHNPAVQSEVLAIMRFWFALGVDGLRLDVVNFYMHDPALRDNPPSRNDGSPNPYYLQAHVYDRSRPENLPFLSRMRAEADQAGARMLLGEISCDAQIERMAEYTRPGRLHTAYSFELLGPRLSGVNVALAVERAGADGAWPCWAFSSHDVVRVASRWRAVGHPARVKMLQAMLLCLRGSVVIYQGEELGLPHSEVPRHRLQDPEAIRFWPNHRGRDGARTPMPWTEEEPSLGFSRAEGWLPAEAAHRSLAISVQETDPQSTLAHCRALLALRHGSSALRLGNWDVIDATETALVFRRHHGEESLICCFNWGEAPIPVAQGAVSLAGGTQSGHLMPDSYVILKEQA